MKMSFMSNDDFDRLVANGELIKMTCSSDEKVSDEELYAAAAAYRRFYEAPWTYRSG